MYDWLIAWRHSDTYSSTLTFFCYNILKHIKHIDLNEPRPQNPKTQAHKHGTNIAVSSSFRAEITRYIEQYVMNCSAQLQTDPG